MVVAVGVGVELVRDMWSVITGFLEDHCMEAAAGYSKNLCGLLARWAWVPLEHGEAVLVVHEVADRVGEGTLPASMKHSGRRFGKWFAPCAVGVADGGLFSRLGGTGILHLCIGLWAAFCFRG